MSARRRSGFIVLLIAALFIAAAGYGCSAAREYIYVFSPSGAFIKIASDTLSVVAQGDLHSEGITEIDGIIADPERRELFIETSRAWSASATGPTSGVAVLRLKMENQQSALRLFHRIPPPPGKTDLTGAIVIGGPNRMLATSWSEDQAGTNEATFVIRENDEFHEPKTSEDFQIGTGTCASSDGSHLFSFSIAAPTEIRTLDLRDLSVHKVSLPADQLKAISPILVISGGAGCRILIVGAAPDGSSDSVPGRIYDLERQTIVENLELPKLGQFFLASSGTLVLVNERKLVQNLLPTGQTVGVRYENTGQLKILDAATGKRTAELKMPEGGTIAASEDANAYYLSKGSLSVVDLKSGNVRGTIPVPFTNGFVAFQREND